VAASGAVAAAGLPHQVPLPRQVLRLLQVLWLLPPFEGLACLCFLRTVVLGRFYW